MRKLALLVPVVGALLWVGGPAQAAPDFDTFDANDATWGCSGDPGFEDFPPNHCMNLSGQGSTGVILVFPPDDRWPQESISTDPKSDSRPCPHDPAATDGTWWQLGDAPVWLCHHRP